MADEKELNEEEQEMTVTLTLDDDTEVEVIMFSMDKTLLGKSDNTDSLVEVFR